MVGGTGKIPQRRVAVDIHFTNQHPLAPLRVGLNRQKMILSRNRAIRTGLLHEGNQYGYAFGACLRRDLIEVIGLLQLAHRRCGAEQCACYNQKTKAA